MVGLSDARRPAAPVLVAFAPPHRQRRLTVAFRLLLALPHIAVLLLLAPPALIVGVGSWVAALGFGRVPRPAADVVCGYLRWQVRVGAYLFLLTDVYPPFSAGDAAYPVRLTVQPAPLRRSAVALRLLLALPVIVVSAIALCGMTTVVLVVSWFLVLVTGRLAPSWHQTSAAVLRYQARLLGYLGLLTAEYPWGLLGDTALAPPPASVVDPSAVAWQPTPPDPAHDPYWRVVLSARAKDLVVFVVVLGVASVVAVNVITAVTRYDRIRSTEAAATRVEQTYGSLSAVVLAYETKTRTCAHGGHPLACLTGAAHSVSRAFATFGDRLSATTVPGAATTARHVLVADSLRAQRAFAQLSTMTTAVRYQLAIESPSLSALLIRFDRDYEQLGARLTISS
jgi:uncharacterized protein DUF4389